MTPPTSRKRATLVFCQRPDSADLPIWTVPLTTPLLAEVLRRAGWEVSLVDARLMPDAAHAPDAELAARTAAAILETAPDVVGFSFLSPAAMLAERTAACLRRDRPDLPLMAGGTHCTVAPERHTAPFDLIVRGEGEAVIAPWAERLAAGFRPGPDDRVVRAPEADLSRSPATIGASWEPYQAIHRPGSRKTAYLQLGRGCAFRCTFCEVAVKSNYSAARRARPPEVVLDEATRWRRDFDTDFFLLIDSIATTAPGFLATFSRLAESLDGCSIMLNSAMPVFRAEEARAIGLWRGPVSVWFGLETASERLGRRILGGKWQQPAIDQALGLSEDEGIDVGLNCIFGFADETAADRERTLELLDRARVAYPNPNILTPLPGTPLYDEYRQRELLRDPDDLSPWPAERIEREGRGPVLGVDYEAVVAAYHAARGLAGRPRRGEGGERWIDWE
jgi:anaerobic magnesium-protoporphyrin IX monomethyl ester cyclase